MSDQAENEREATLYQAYHDGDHDAIDKSRNRAKDTEAWQRDHDNAYNRYQADHEPDEAERERLTAEAVQRDNHDAMEAL